MNTSPPILTPTPLPVAVAAPTRVSVDEDGLNLSLNEALRSDTDPVMRGIGFDIIEWEILDGDGGGLMACLRSLLREEKSLFILELDSFFVAVGEV